MKILVDTCVWSQALRYKNPDPTILKRLTDLIADGRAVLIGPIKQEILSGISRIEKFQELAKVLAAFEEIQLRSVHFEKAAEFCNFCRLKGIQGSTIDFLICAVAHCENLSIFTLDSDFYRYAKYMPIHLVE